MQIISSMLLYLRYILNFIFSVFPTNQFLLSRVDSEPNLPGMANRKSLVYLTYIFQLPDCHLFCRRILCTLAVVTVMPSLITTDFQFVVYMLELSHSIYSLLFPLMSRIKGFIPFRRFNFNLICL